MLYYKFTTSNIHFYIFEINMIHKYIMFGFKIDCVMLILNNVSHSSGMTNFREEVVL